MATLLGGAELSVSHHAAGHVQQHNRRTGCLVLGVVDDQIVLGHADRLAPSLPMQRVPKRFLHVEIADRIAVSVRLRLLVDSLPGSTEFRVVSAQGSFVADIEECLEGPILDAADSLGRNDELAVAVLLDVAALDEHVDDVRVLLLPLIEIGENLVTVVHHVFREFVEDLIGRLRCELFGTVPP